MKYIILIGILIFFIGCETSKPEKCFENIGEVCFDGVQPYGYDRCEKNCSTINEESLIYVSESLAENKTEREAMENECFDEGHYYCGRLCSEESGLILSDDMFSININQFDLDNDGNFSFEERRNWDYIEKRYQVCHLKCVEEIIYPCYRRARR